MQPKEIARLDPHYADEKGFAEFAARRRLHEATIQLNTVAEQQGQPVSQDEFFLKARIFEMLCLDEPPHEAFFEARVLPPHDTFTTPEGATVPSRLLVVDARHPLAENTDEPKPSRRNRAYFLLLGENPLRTGEPTDILPYFVVSEREITGKDQPDETLHHMASTVFYSPHISGWPLHRGPDPEHVYEPEAYAAMAAELELAVSRLTGEADGS